MKPGTLQRIEREWRGATEVALVFPMRAKATAGYNEAVAIERGPLVYALKIGESWTQVNADKPHRELPHGDFEVRPTTPWNYGLVVDANDAGASVRFEERPVGDRPFSPEGAGIVATARAGCCRIGGSCAAGRRSCRSRRRVGQPGRARLEEPLEELTLIPYGCTNIRITEFPRLKG